MADAENPRAIIGDNQPPDAFGALKAHRREVLEIHAPEAAQQEENAEDRSRREADQFRAFVAERRRLREEGE